MEITQKDRETESETETGQEVESVESEELGI